MFRPSTGRATRIAVSATILSMGLQVGGTFTTGALAADKNGGGKQEKRAHNGDQTASRPPAAGVGGNR